MHPQQDQTIRVPHSQALQAAACDLQLQVLLELQATQLGGHIGSDKPLALARSSVWRPGLYIPVAEFVQTCPTCQRVKADRLLPARLSFPVPDSPSRLAAVAASASTFSSCPPTAPATTSCRCPPVASCLSPPSESKPRATSLQQFFVVWGCLTCLSQLPTTCASRAPPGALDCRQWPASGTLRYMTSYVIS
jgi:hypothetical protein